mmetsp:Transcript_22388/g.46694  ORF Transcript_22388/g.46694 Transcript_22388/m.46694 type:complete len:140 (+) Transcript_22388:732-1151(+)
MLQLNGTRTSMSGYPKTNIWVLLHKQVRILFLGRYIMFQKNKKERYSPTNGKPTMTSKSNANLPYTPKPPGRKPKGKMWDPIIGSWVPENVSSTKKIETKPILPPTGRPPKGKVWENGGWVLTEDSVEAIDSVDVAVAL